MLKRITGTALLILVSVAGAEGLGKVGLEQSLRPVPARMNLQGYLTDSQGNPIGGVRTMEFRIRAVVSVLWEETQACTVDAGLFCVQLGAVRPIPESAFVEGGTRYLDVVVEGETLEPAVELSSTGFAFRSGDVDRPLSPGVASTEIQDDAVTMPKIDGSGAAPGYVIKWNGSGWAPAPDSAGGVSGPAGGDLSGTYPNPSVVKLRGRTISTTTPYAGDVLGYESSQWVPLDPGGDIEGAIDDIEVVGLRGRDVEDAYPYTNDMLVYKSSRWEIEAPGGDVDGPIDDLTVTGLQGRAVYNTYPSTGEVLTWYSSRWEPREPGGDIDGYIYDVDVVGLQGRPVSTSSPSSGDVLTWYSSQWTPRSPGMGLTVDAGGYGRRQVFPVRSPEPWCEDFGSLRLAGGRARVELDPVFLAAVETDGSDALHVFLQQTSGEPVSVVVHKDRSGFEVVGPRGSDAEFDYRVVARCRGEKAGRFDPVETGER